MVLWSNLSCIRLGGQRFESHLYQFFRLEKNMSILTMFVLSPFLWLNTSSPLKDDDIMRWKIEMETGLDSRTSYGAI